MEKLDKDSENGLIEFFKRERGFSTPTAFSRRISASQTLVKKMDQYGKLSGHQGCVNTVEFNSTGDLLVSGSDDKQVMFWDWAAQKLKFSYPSGHMDNIFQARIMPFTDDRKIVTSSADCQVRLGEILENGQVETKRLAKHHGRVHKLAVEPGSPYIFYSCGNRQTPRSSIGLNAIVIDPRNPNYFAVGGADAFARVYDIRKYQLDASTKQGSPFTTFCPRRLIQTNDVHITALAYSNTTELLVSYNDELIYLFHKNLGLGPDPFASPPEDLSKLDEVETYSGHRNSQTVKGVNFFGPNDEYVLSGSDCGRVFIWKKKGAELVRLMVGDRHIVNQLETHPLIPVLATCGIEKNIKLWAPSSNDFKPLPENVLEIMEANKRGREEQSRVTLTPDVIMHVLRLHGREAQVYVERRRNREDVDSDDDGEGESYVLGFSDGEASEENGVSRECIII